MLRADGAKIPARVLTKYIQEAKAKFLHVFGFKLVECSSKDTIAEVASSQDAASQNKPDMFILINALQSPSDPPPRGEGGAAPDNVEDPVAATSRLLAAPLGANRSDTPDLPADFHLAMVIMAIIALERYSHHERLLCHGQH